MKNKILLDIALDVYKNLIIGLANELAECDNFDDARDILDQVAGEEYESRS